MKREFAIFAFVIGTILAVLLYSEFKYDYIYVLKQWGDGLKYLFRLEYESVERNYGILLIKPLLWLGIPGVQALNLFYYTLIAVSLSFVYWILRKYSPIIAITGTAWIALYSSGFYLFYYNAAILALASLLIFQLSLAYVLSRYIATGSIKWYVLAILLPLANIIFYQSGGYVAVGYLLVYASIFGDLKFKVGSIIVGIIAGLYFLFNHGAVNSVLNTLSYLSLIIGVLILVTIIIIARNSHIRALCIKNPLTTSLAMLLLLYLLAYLFTAGEGGLDNYRVSWNIGILSSLLGLLSAFMVYKRFQFRWLQVAFALMCVILGFAIWTRWSSNHFEDITTEYKQSPVINISELKGEGNIYLSLGRGKEYVLVSKKDKGLPFPGIDLRVRKVGQNHIVDIYEIMEYSP